MGMFNTVHVRCPKCREVHFRQTKGGSCEMKHFDLGNAPIDDIASLIDTTFNCVSCGSAFKVHATVSATTVQVFEEE